MPPPLSCTHFLGQQMRKTASTTERKRGSRKDSLVPVTAGLPAVFSPGPVRAHRASVRWWDAYWIRQLAPSTCSSVCLAKQQRAVSTVGSHRAGQICRASGVGPGQRGLRAGVSAPGCRGSCTVDSASMVSHVFSKTLLFGGLQRVGLSDPYFREKGCLEKPQANQKFVYDPSLQSVFCDLRSVFTSPSAYLQPIPKGPHLPSQSLSNRSPCSEMLSVQPYPHETCPGLSPGKTVTVACWHGPLPQVGIAVPPLQAPCLTLE